MPVRAPAEDETVGRRSQRSTSRPAADGKAKGVHVERISGRAARRDFLHLPWSIYSGDPCWVPPLVREEMRMINRRHNPFFEYGSADLFGAYDASGTIVGRVAAIYNPRFVAHHAVATGFFGMFECLNDQQIARLLLDTVRDRLREFGCRTLLGPVTMTPNEEVGVLIEGGGAMPMILTNYAPPYYGDLLEGCGLSKAVDLLTYSGRLGHRLPAKFDRVVASARSRGDVSLRTFDRAQWEREIETIRGLYNTTFMDTWGFVPLTAAEAHGLGRLLRFSDEKLVVLAECEGEPVGCILAALDVNEILKDLNGRLFPFGALKLLRSRRRISGIRVMVLCVLPRFRSRGIEALLIDAVHQRMTVRNYRRAEFSFVFENNVRMRRLLEALGFARLKLHRVFEGLIDPRPDGAREGGRTP